MYCVPFSSSSSHAVAVSAAVSAATWLLLLSADFKSERRSTESHVVTLGGSEESLRAVAGAGEVTGFGVFPFLFSVGGRRCAVSDDLVEVGQVLIGGVDSAAAAASADALVVAGPPGVADVHGAAAVRVERDRSEAAAEAGRESGKMGASRVKCISSNQSPLKHLQHATGK